MAELHGNQQDYLEINPYQWVGVSLELGGSSAALASNCPTMAVRRQG